MSFQVQNSPMRSTFQGVPVRSMPVCARQAQRAPVRIQAYGALESVPVIVEAMKIGFAYAAIPGVLKGAWDLKQAMAEPHFDKSQAGKREPVLVTGARYGCAGALMGLSAGVLATQCNFTPDNAWQAGTVTGLCLYAILVGVAKQALPAQKTDGSKASKLDKAPTDASDDASCEVLKQDQDAE